MFSPVSFISFASKSFKIAEGLKYFHEAAHLIGSLVKQLCKHSKSLTLSSATIKMRKTNLVVCSCVEPFLVILDKVVVTV